MLKIMKLAGVFLFAVSALACDRTDPRPEVGSREGSISVEDASAEAMEVTLEVPEFVGRVAEVAVAIEEAPERAAEILSAHELTRERLDSLVYEIASREGWTDAFLEVIGR